MSEQLQENPEQAAQPGASEQQQTSPPPSSGSVATTGDEFPLSFVKRETGATHWNVAKGVWEKVAHAETGEPDSEYVLVATIGGVEVPLESYSAGRLETVVRSQQQSQQSQQTEG